MMIYRPNFCCSCGEKIERAAWPLLASRRFCDLCQTEHQTADWLPRITVILGLVLAAAGVVAMFRPTQHIENAGVSRAADIIPRAGEHSTASQNNATPQSISQSQTGPILAETQPSPTTPPVTLRSAVTAHESDAVYYCGAATRKGTACTRRVKRPGERCWQHQGMPAMADNAQKIMR